MHLSTYDLTNFHQVGIKLDGLYNIYHLTLRRTVVPKGTTCFNLLSAQVVIISTVIGDYIYLTSNNQLLFVMKTQCDPCDLKFEFLNIICINRVFRRCCSPRLINFEAIGAVEKRLISKHRQMVNKMPVTT